MIYLTTDQTGFRKRNFMAGMQGGFLADINKTKNSRNMKNNLKGTSI